MVYFDKEKGEFVWQHSCFFMHSASFDTIEFGDSPQKVQACQTYYNLVKTTNSPYTLVNYIEGKKYTWTGKEEVLFTLNEKDAPVNWDIVIAVLMRFHEEGKLTKKYQHAFIFKLLKQKECGEGCEEMTMDDYLEKLKHLDKELFKLPTNSKVMSKYLPLHDKIAVWSMKEGDLHEAQEFAYSFVEDYYKTIQEVRKKSSVKVD